MSAPPSLLHRLEAAADEGLEANLGRFLSFVGWVPGEVVELQVIGVPPLRGSWVDGRFEPGRQRGSYAAHASTMSDVLRLVQAAEEWRCDDGTRVMGVYTLVNQPFPGVAARGPSNTWNLMSTGTSDAEIQVRRALYIDLDAVRPKDVSALDAHVSRVFDRTEVLTSLLARHAPVEAIGHGHSGNGSALFLALDSLACDDEVDQLVRAVLHICRHLVSDPEMLDERCPRDESRQFVSVDTSVIDRKRLCPAFGSWKRKGADLPDRPHRQTAFLAPTEAVRLELDDLRGLAAGLRASLDSDAARATIDKLLTPRPAPSTARSSAPSTRRARSAGTGSSTPATREALSTFQIANQIPMQDVLRQLELLDGDRPICPGCHRSDRPGGMVEILGNALKCSSGTCSDKGHPSHPGLRTVVDVVMEAEEVDARTALLCLREAFPDAHIPEQGDDPTRPQTGHDALPVVVVDHRIGDRVRQVEEILVQRPDTNLYVRDGQLVSVAEAGQREKWQDDAQTPIPRPISLPALRALLTDCIDFQRRVGLGKGDRGSGRLTSCRPPDDVTKGLHQATGWRLIRELVGVVRSPFLATKAGDVVTSSGYDPQTRYLLLVPSHLGEVHVPVTPTREDARQAYEELVDDVLGDFPFASPRDRSVACAALLTLLARPALGRANVPGFIVEAPTRGTGKTLLTDVVATVGAGAPMAKITFPASDEELTKTLFSIASEARQAVSFDNINLPIGGDALDGVLTCRGLYSGRVLGVSQTRECHWRTTLFFSGNNPTFRGDIGRRVLICRLDAAMERPGARAQFKHGDLLGYVHQHQTHFAALGLTILRAFCLTAGDERPRLRPLASFEQWTQIVASALVWLGAENPCDAIPDASAESPDPTQVAIRTLLATWNSLAHHPRIAWVSQTGLADGEPLPGWGPTGARTQTALRGLYPDGVRSSHDGYDDLREAIDTLTGIPEGRVPSAKQLGRALARHRDQVADGRKLVGRPDRKGYLCWSVQEVGSAEFADSGRVSEPGIKQDDQPVVTLPDTPTVPTLGSAPQSGPPQSRPMSANSASGGAVARPSTPAPLVPLPVVEDALVGHEAPAATAAADDQGVALWKP